MEKLIVSSPSPVVKTRSNNRRSADRELRTCFDCQIGRYFDKRCCPSWLPEQISIEIEKHGSVAISRKLFDCLQLGNEFPVLTFRYFTKREIVVRLMNGKRANYMKYKGETSYGSKYGAKCQNVKLR